MYTRIFLLGMGRDFRYNDNCCQDAGAVNRISL